MADTNGIDAVAPSLNLTNEEKRVFGQLFRQADTENIGVVTGEVAVKFFEKTRLDPRILGEIWQIADKENRGLLTPAGFGIVLRLIGHYQAGQDPTPELAFRSGPLPRFDGGLPGGPSIQPPPNVFTPTIQPQSSGSGPIRVPPLTPDKVAQYSGLFEKSGAQNGVLPGEQAKQIFERAGLPNEILGKIWNLADTEQRGALVMTEFIIAMHLLASFKSGAMRALPAILPAGLYEAAARRPQRQTSGSTPLSAIPRQFSGAGAGRTGSPLGRSGYGPPVQTPQFTGQMTGQAGDWAINSTDKARFDTIYTTLDRTNRGFITGDEAVPFFSNSKLPEEALAQIWDLADINSQGHLTRDEFAVAMYLIRQQRGKQDGRDNLPTTLPSNLIPPSMRNQARPPQQPTAPTFDAQPQMPKSAMDDLFGLDALSSPSSSAPPQVPLSTGGSTGFNDPFNSRSPMAPSSPVQQGSPQHPTGFKPFVPSSSFGRTLNYENTGGSNSSGQTTQRSIQPQSTGMDDLLGDNDPETSKKLSGETMELANLSNQVGSLSKQMQDVQGQRAASQNELNHASTQKREFEGRLAQLRSLYEQEVKDVNGLKQTLATTKNETQKLQQELAMVEGSHQDLQTQRQHISQALQADQQENVSLKERMRVLNAEIAQLKPQLEKLRSDARQQKGLVAINKKQMATSESERDKLKTEAEQLTKSNEEDSRAIAAGSQGTPPNVASPALSTMSANNPFFRRQSSSADAVLSPFATQSPAPAQQERSFDNVFGPSFGASTPSTMPPTTTFKQESTSSHSIPVTALETALPAASIEASRVASPIPAPTPGSLRDPAGSEVPAPPASRQISSSYLPFSSAATESVSSSRQVSAPNSRFGEGSTGTETPTHQESTPTGSSSGGQEVPATGSVSNGSNSIPGAFPDSMNVTPFSGNTLSERGMGANSTGSSDPFSFNKPPAAAKDDFDSAFAGFGAPSNLKREASERSGSAAGSSNFHSEFPPLEELVHDDESDSGSEGGFEDDFTSASPGHSRKESALQGSSVPSRVAASGSEALAPPPSFTENPDSSALSVGKNPPAEDAQRSPPPYNSTVSPHDRAQAEADQYAGLLPKREDSLSAPILSPEQSFQFVSTPSQSGISAKEVTKPAPPAKIPFDDFDNEFDDLEDAKEGTEDDDFANLSIHDRSVIDDFNPMFDSPAASKTSNQTGQGSGFGSQSNGFGEFTSSPTRTPAPVAPAPAVHDNHDWDAIFAGLDGPNTTPATNTGPADDEITPAPPAPSAKEVPSAPSAGLGTSSTTSGGKPRPEFGRALTEAGVHDDPILKELRDMGYERKDALAALEKYDYNLERAANYLASQS